MDQIILLVRDHPGSGLSGCSFVAYGVLLSEKDYMGIVMIVAIFVYHIIEAHMISDYLGRNYLYFLLGAYFSRMLSGKERQGHEGT